MRKYGNVLSTPEVEEALEHMTKLLDRPAASVSAMCVLMIYNYFNDKQLLMEAPMYLPRDGRRKK